MRLRDLVAEGRVAIPLAATGKEEVLRELAGLFDDLNSQQVYRVLADREAVASTGVGSGVAIPHGRMSGLAGMCAAIGIQPEGVSFDAIDGKPVRIFVALLAPDGRAGDHLKALARFSRLLRVESVRQRLLTSESAEDLLGIIEAEDGA